MATKKLLTNDVSRGLAKQIYQAHHTKGVPFRELEDQFGLASYNGMTAYRVVTRYQRYIKLRRSRKPNEASLVAGFAK